MPCCLVPNGCTMCFLLGQRGAIEGCEAGCTVLCRTAVWVPGMRCSACRCLVVIGSLCGSCMSVVAFVPVGYTKRSRRARGRRDFRLLSPWHHDSHAVEKAGYKLCNLGNTGGLQRQFARSCKLAGPLKTTVRCGLMSSFLCNIKAWHTSQLPDIDCKMFTSLLLLFRMHNALFFSATPRCLPCNGIDRQ